MAGKNEHWNWRHLLRPRTAIYFGAWAAVGLAMLVTLVNRTQLDVNVVPDRNPLFVTLSDGAIRNGYTVKILNKTPGAAQLPPDARRPPRRHHGDGGRAGAKGTSVEISVEPDKLKAVKVYVTTSRS